MSCSPQKIIHRIATQALTRLSLGDYPPLVQPATKSEFGDVQINGVMGIAKAQKKNPRELASVLVSALKEEGIERWVERIDIAGPGFINLFYQPTALAALADKALADERLGVDIVDKPDTVLIDYSSPNLAKEMHVGHLRSTIIGDALVRVFSFLGHRVIRANHVGDWGTQFGMLLAHFVEQESKEAINLADLEAFYREAKKRFDHDSAFAERARDFVGRLQGGESAVMNHWREFLRVSLAHAQAVYARLGVLLTPDDVVGESFYNDDLPKVIASLRARGLIREDEGAQVVFLDEFKNPEGGALAVILQKRDGSFLYATTDLAAIRYRASLGVNRALYVVDARQSLHFQTMFHLATKAELAPSTMSLEHIPFGMVLGDDGKPFKTRSGDTVKLMDLLDSAYDRALALVRDKQPTADEQTLSAIAQAVGMGAVKYADLSKSRQSDYVFSIEQMLSMEGNTAPYLMYAYARIQSLFRKSTADGYGDWMSAPMTLSAPEEKALAAHVLQFDDVLQTLVHTAQPHHLCTFLYTCATLYSRFYESCPILKSEPALRASRLKLSALTANTLKVGLSLLGINVLSAM